MLAMGAAKPWPDAMEVLTGERKMNGSGLLQYFKPLQTWLEQENAKNGAFLGWEKSTKGTSICIHNNIYNGIYSIYL